MALTLVEMSKMALGKDMIPLSVVMELYARNADVLQYLPIDDITGNAMQFLREAALPNVGFRGVNEGYTEGTAQLDKIIESLSIAGGDLDVDKFLVDTGGPNIRATQESLKIKALSLSLAKTVIKGDIDTDPKSFDGLQARCTGNQIVAAGSTAGGDVLSLAKLDELIDVTEEPTHLIMNKTMRRRLTAAARNSAVGGYITYDVDMFGRQIVKYNDLPILIADKDNTYADVMPFTEVCPGGGGNTGTSIYCVSFMEDGVLGIQNGTMSVRDLGELEDKPVYRTRVEWYMTLAILRKRSATRLWGIKDGSVVV
jgi:hypothetical protein